MPSSKSTRLRFISSSSAEELEKAVQALPFMVEIKSVMVKGVTFYCWFVLPDHIKNHDLENFIEARDKELNVDVQSLSLEKIVG